MNIGKGLSKSKIITIIIAALVIIALVVSMIFVLKGCMEDKPSEDEEISLTNPTVTSDPMVTSDSTDSSDPENTTEPIGTPDPSASATATSKPKANTFTVIFKDFNGTVLKTQKVEKGKSATAPEDPKRENFKFSGWDKAFNKITSDLVVTATYTTTKSVIYAEHVSVNKGTGEATIKIRVINNPGIMGAVLKVSVNDSVLSFKEAKKTEYPGLTLTSPGDKTTSSPYTFLLDSIDLGNDDKKDGTLFTITFNIKDKNATGKYDISLSYDSGAIFDENYKDPKICLENGSITIK